MYWLLEEGVLRTIAHARKTYVASVEQLTAFEELFKPAAEGMPRNLRIAGDVAEIRVEGVLSKKPDFWSWYFGGGNTTYEQIQQALAICAADDTIKKVRFYVDSPGGNVDGLFDALSAIDAFAKPKSVATAYACSAAYAIAALGGKIEATNAAVQVGSIGVAIRYVDYEGVDIIDITSTEAPEQAPGPDDGRGEGRHPRDARCDPRPVRGCDRPRSRDLESGRQRELRARRRAARG
jgi:ClpP class serine protease